MSDCIFCKIIEKKIPASIVYEDDQVIAIKDINPVTPFHVLIIPKQHIENINDINKENAHVISLIHLAAVSIAKENELNDSGYRLITNCGENAGQTVMHLHYHMLGGKELGATLI